ncbi:sugar kinase [Gordonia sp. TBRC 11910]|uniref:Sugar kinase n=1 Tax=Gordonia asplenii TaxID=2725283 RepID=A0A848L5R2_9ACTN|nr:sugar kinase [Gordonia asplenii]NMO03891.1 sugar kinase [Gordonia asplenii]
MSGPLVVCLGEPLALVAADDLDVPDAAMKVGGAEANVATALAALDVPTGYISRVGADPQGTAVLNHLRSYGVDVGAVEVDAHLPTGRYAKTEGVDDGGEPVTSSTYRRAGSAASAMGTDMLRDPAVAAALAGARIVHLSGITPPLSTTCADLLSELMIRRTGVVGRVTFDVNWREQLWPDADPAPLLPLADAADVTLVGADEAERVFGTDDPAELRALLPDPELLIIKDGAVKAIAVSRDGSRVSADALSVVVVEPVGAGDSFAAGFLHGLALGEPVRTCLRRGHIGAAATLTVRGDLARMPDDAVAALLDADDETWSAARISPDGVRVGGIDYPAAVEVEIREGA